MALFSDASASIADPMLSRAYLLAERGRGTAHPNPVVGCVIVAADGEVAGEGWHQRAGGLHAEVEALLHARDRARDATAYVTLEPCNHVGRTGACAKELVEAGVASVVIGAADPNPDVAGGGADALREAGVAVRFAEDPAPFEAQNEDWRKHVTTRMPWVQAKLALTLDARPTLEQGRRSPLSGEQARALTMRLRAEADAVLVGSSTLRVDDPSLTVRDADGRPAERQPMRVVIARSVPPHFDASLFSDTLGPVAALMPEDMEIEAPEDVTVVRYDSRGGLPGALAALGERDIVRVLAEPGPRLFAELWRQGLADELVLYHTGLTAGDAAAAIGAPEERRMCAVEAAVLGKDAVTVWRPAGAS